jgi:hypothetical protein
VAVRETEIDVLLQAQAAFQHVYTIARAMYPDCSVNDPIVARIGNLGPAVAIGDYIVVEVRSTRWCGRIESTPEHPNVGRVPYELTGESSMHWEAGE